MGIRNRQGGLWLAVAGAALLAGCNSNGSAPDDPVERLFSNHYQELVLAAGSHHAGCDLALAAKGPGGTKRDTLTTSVDVDKMGNYRLVHEDGSELIRVGLHTWQKDAEGAIAPIEAGANADLQRDTAAAEWRGLLAPIKDHVKLKATGSGTLGSRETTKYDLTFTPGGSGDGPKVEKGAGKIEVDSETGVPVKVSLTASWSAPAPEGGAGRVEYSLEKMECAVTKLGGVEPIVAPGSSIAAASPAPAESAAATATPKEEETKKPVAKPHGSKRHRRR